MIIDCISDLHGHYPILESGDLLIIAGDLTRKDTPQEFTEFLRWAFESDYKKIIFIAGNHDNHIQAQAPNSQFGFEQYINPNKEMGIYLCDSSTVFEGVKIYGSPWTLAFEGMNPRCKAFTVETDDELKKKWKQIPYDIDILITHSPPYSILDTIKEERYDIRPHVGSESLSLAIAQRPSIKLHVFGHIHESYGKYEGKNTTFINASHVNEYYEPVNKTIRIVI